MITIPKERGRALENLFSYSNDTFILSYVQGHFGTGFADSEHAPTVGCIRIADICLLAGDAASPAARELVQCLFDGSEHDEMLVTPQNQMWSELIENVYGSSCEKIKRYAIKKDTVFNRDVLWSYVRGLPEGYSLRHIDSELYAAALQNGFSHDFCSTFQSAEAYAKNGLGFVALYDGEIVAGASSITFYNGGIEIEIDTRADHRRRHLALACGARLILECLDRGRYPSWDAASLISVALAEKLGYELDTEYDAYMVKRLN